MVLSTLYTIVILYDSQSKSIHGKKSTFMKNKRKWMKTFDFLSVMSVSTNEQNEMKYSALLSEETLDTDISLPQNGL